MLCKAIVYLFFNSSILFLFFSLLIFILLNFEKKIFSLFSHKIWIIRKNESKPILAFIIIPKIIKFIFIPKKVKIRTIFLSKKKMKYSPIFQMAFFLALLVNLAIGDDGDADGSEPDENEPEWLNAKFDPETDKDYVDAKYFSDGSCAVRIFDFFFEFFSGKILSFKFLKIFFLNFLKNFFWMFSKFFGFVR